MDNLYHLMTFARNHGFAAIADLSRTQFGEKPCVQVCIGWSSQGTGTGNNEWVACWTLRDVKIALGY